MLKPHMSYIFTEKNAIAMNLIGDLHAVCDIPFRMKCVSVSGRNSLKSDLAIGGGPHRMRTNSRKMITNGRQCDDRRQSRMHNNDGGISFFFVSPKRYSKVIFNCKQTMANRVIFRVNGIEQGAYRP